MSRGIKKPYKLFIAKNLDHISYLLVWHLYLLTYLTSHNQTKRLDDLSPDLLRHPLQQTFCSKVTVRRFDSTAGSNEDHCLENCIILTLNKIMTHKRGEPANLSKECCVVSCIDQVRTHVSTSSLN